MEQSEVRSIVAQELMTLQVLFENNTHKIEEILNEFTKETLPLWSTVRNLLMVNHTQDAARLIHKIKVRYSYLGFEKIYHQLDAWECALNDGLTAEEPEITVEYMEHVTSIIIKELNQRNAFIDSPSCYPSVQRALLGKSILLAEDDQLNAMVFELLIEESGGSFTLAVDGWDAVNRAESNPPDMIFMDLHLPIVSGIQAIQAIRKRGLNMPIISLSASSNLKEKDASIAAGANDFIGKPVKRSDIKGMLEKYLKVSTIL